jgi:hypothetical protein
VLTQLYAQEISENIENRILLNRFYKLREKAKDLLIECFKNANIGISAIEKELNFISFLISNKQFSQAKESLLILEKKCWEENIFEILPEIYNKLFKIIIAFVPIDDAKMKEYFAKRNVALQLRQDLELFLDNIYLFRIKDTKNTLSKMLKKLKKLTPYPRFKLIYYYLSFCNCVIEEAVNNKINNSTRRYFNNLSKFLEQDFNIPILSITDTRLAVTTRLLGIELTFWATRNNHFQIKQVLTRILENSHYYENASEDTLLNLCQNALRTNFFEPAYIFINTLKKYQEIQYYDNKAIFHWQFFELEWYCKQYPNIQPPSIIEYFEIILSAIEARDFEQECVSAIGIFGVFITYTITTGYLDFADKLLKMPLWKLYEQKMPIASEIPIFYELVKTANWQDLLVFQTEKSLQSKQKGINYRTQGHLKLLADASKVVLKIKKAYLTKVK